MIISPTQFTLPFLHKEYIAKDTYSFYFDLSTKPEYTFSAGQYTRLLLDLPEGDPRGRSRMFTTSSSPDQKDNLIITTKITDYPSIFKRQMMQIKKGQRVDFFGPMGGFILPTQSKRPLVFLAGGIGVTPFHSMLLYAAKINYKTPITLIASFSTVEEAIFFNELSKLGNDYPSIKVVYTISHPEDSREKWKGEKGRISEELIRKHISDMLLPDYFISGPSVMVGDMLNLLEEMKIPLDQVREEQLTGY
jgi:ferredoxin-NADP reductase